MLTRSDPQANSKLSTNSLSVLTNSVESTRCSVSICDDSLVYDGAMCLDHPYLLFKYKVPQTSVEKVKKISVNTTKCFVSFSDDGLSFIEGMNYSLQSLGMFYIQSWRLL